MADIPNCVDVHWRYPCRFKYTIVENDTERDEILSLPKAIDKTKRDAALKKIQEEWEAEDSATDREDIEIVDRSEGEDSFDDMQWVDDMRWVDKSVLVKRVRLNLRMNKKRTDKKELQYKQNLNKSVQRYKKVVGKYFNQIPKEKRDKIVEKRFKQANSGLVDDYKKHNIYIRKQLREEKQKYNSLLEDKKLLEQKSEEYRHYAPHFSGYYAPAIEEVSGYVTKSSDQCAKLVEMLEEINKVKEAAEKQAYDTAKQKQAEAKCEAQANINADLSEIGEEYAALESQEEPAWSIWDELQRDERQAKKRHAEAQRQAKKRHAEAGRRAQRQADKRLEASRAQRKKKTLKIKKIIRKKEPRRELVDESILM